MPQNESPNARRGNDQTHSVLLLRTEQLCFCAPSTRLPTSSVLPTGIGFRNFSSRDIYPTRNIFIHTTVCSSEFFWFHYQGASSVVFRSTTESFAPLYCRREGGSFHYQTLFVDFFSLYTTAGFFFPSTTIYCFFLFHYQDSLPPYCTTVGFHYYILLVDLFLTGTFSLLQIVWGFFSYWYVFTTLYCSWIFFSYILPQGSFSLPLLYTHFFCFTTRIVCPPTILPQVFTTRYCLWICFLLVRFHYYRSFGDFFLLVRFHYSILFVDFFFLYTTVGVFFPSTTIYCFFLFHYQDSLPPYCTTVGFHYQILFGDWFSLLYIVCGFVPYQQVFTTVYLFLTGRFSLLVYIVLTGWFSLLSIFYWCALYYRRFSLLVYIVLTGRFSLLSIFCWCASILPQVFTTSIYCSYWLVFTTIYFLLVRVGFHYWILFWFPYQCASPSTFSFPYSIYEDSLPQYCLSFLFGCATSALVFLLLFVLLSKRYSVPLL